jgi:hypothetical protein
MCLISPKKPEKDDHFRNICWKVLYINPNGVALTPFYPHVVECGKIYYANEARIVSYDNNYMEVEYESGFHVFYNESAAEYAVWVLKKEETERIQQRPRPRHLAAGYFTKRPVLIADITAVGSDFTGLHREAAAAARIIYYLTEEEYIFLTSDHKPITVNEDNEVEVAL